MTATFERSAKGASAVDYTDFVHVGPGTIAGRYLRRFWQPVYVARDLPAVYGEAIDGDVAGYHYIPGRGQVVAWIADARFDVVDEACHAEDGWSYRHFLLRRRVDTP